MHTSFLVMSTVKIGLFVIILLVAVVLLFFGKDWYAGSVKMTGKSWEPEDVHVKDGFVNVHLPNQQVVRIFYREVNPLHKQIETGVNGGDADNKKPVKMDVLLLHGQIFSSKTWLDLGTISILGKSGHRTVAVDLPGYGHSSVGKTEKSKIARDVFLNELIKVLGLVQPAIVSPSMSGSFSMPLLMSKPEVFGAYIPVAPVQTERFSPEEYKKIRVPTLIVYGSEDKNLGRVSLHNLQNLPVKEVVMLPDASHPAYLDQPTMWHTRLKKFLNEQQKVVH